VAFVRGNEAEAHWLDRIMRSAPYRLAAFLVDYVASVKLPLRAHEDAPGGDSSGPGADPGSPQPPGGQNAGKPPPGSIAGVLKRIYIAVAAITALVGCATLAALATPDRIYAITKLAAYVTCSQRVSGTPVERTSWVSAYGALKVLNDAPGQWGPAEVVAALDKAGVSEMIGSEGQLTIAGGLALLDTFTGVLTSIHTLDQAQAAARGAMDGIGLALDANVPTRREAILQRLTTEAQGTRPHR
jgi:hypothetical protein